MPLPHVRVSADDPFERGRQLGATTADRIQRSIEIYDETFSYYTALPWPRIKDFAARFREPIEAYDAAIMREIEGVAAGASLDLEDLLAINARSEIMFGLARRGAPECTTFFAGPPATADGHVLVGQSWDWRPCCESNVVLVEVEQGDRPSFVSIVEAGQVGKLGFNSAGIALGVNLLVSDVDHGEANVPFHVILRGILNARTPEEAVAAVVRARRGASGNYVIASATGEAVDLETGPGGVETVRMIHPENGLLWHSNHFTCDIPFGDAVVDKWVDSPVRLQTIGERLDSARGTLTRESATEHLRDHTGYPDSICRHPNDDVPEVERSASVVAWVIDATDRVASLRVGTPCSGEFTTFAPAFARASVAVT